MFLSDIANLETNVILAHESPKSVKCILYFTILGECTYNQKYNFPSFKNTKLSQQVIFIILEIKKS